MQKPKIGIILGTTREGRFGPRPTAWIHQIASRRDDMETEVVDLLDYPLPLFNDPRPPIYVPSSNPVAQRLSAKMASFDGYIFVTAEYNHGPSGVLKNAIDHLFPELGRKPAAFVGYGGVGAARAVEQLRLILIELRAAPLRDAVHIGLAELRGLHTDKSFDDFPHLAQSAGTMLDQLAWWARTLAQGRTE